MQQPHMDPPDTFVIPAELVRKKDLLKALLIMFFFFISDIARLQPVVVARPLHTSEKTKFLNGKKIVRMANSLSNGGIQFYSLLLVELNTASVFFRNSICCCKRVTSC